MEWKDKQIDNNNLLECIVGILLKIEKYFKL